MSCRFSAGIPTPVNTHARPVFSESIWIRGNLHGGLCEGEIPRWCRGQTGRKLETVETAKEDLRLIGISSTRRDPMLRRCERT
jgi:hypothetical protein